MTASTSCIRVSRSGTPAGLSDIPVPRLSNRIEPSHRAEPVEEVGVPRVGPVQLEVGHESGDQDDVEDSPPPVTW